jgi:rhodanese-related sulfurtransferase
MIKMKMQFLSLAAVILSATVAVAGSYPAISMEDLQQAIADKKATVIDVNGTNSYQEGHIPTAIDFMAVKGDLASKLPADKDALVVAYCGSSACGAYAKAATAATDLGYTNVKYFKPGISGWKEAGAATEAAE